MHAFRAEMLRFLEKYSDLLPDKEGIVDKSPLHSATFHVVIIYGHTRDGKTRQPWPGLELFNNIDLPQPFESNYQ